MINFRNIGIFQTNFRYRKELENNGLSREDLTFANVPLDTNLFFSRTTGSDTWLIKAYD